MGAPLQPRYTLDVAEQRWTEQALEIRLLLAPAPLLDILEVRFPPQAPLAAAPGDPALLTLDSGEKQATVFTGQVVAIASRVTGIRLRALDAGGLLARARTAAAFEGISAGNLVRSLCAETGAEVGEVDDGPTLAFYAAEPARTLWEHVGRVVAWGGALAAVSPQNRVVTRVVNASAAEIALRYGRELLELSSARHDAPLAATTVAGEAGAGDAAAPEAFRPTTDFFAGNRPEGPAPDRRWLSEPALRTVKAAGVAGAARQRAYDASRLRGSFAAFLQPDLRPGSVIQIQDAPDGPHDVLWLHQVEHRLARDGALTRARFYRGGDSFDPSALLGSLAGLL